MNPVSVTKAIDVPRERVFELLCDLAARPSFCDHFVEEYRLQRLDPVGVGAAARFRLSDGEWLETVIDEVDPPYLIRERGRAGRLNRIPTFTVWELVGGSTGSCEVTVTFWTEPSNPFDRLRELRGRERRRRRHWAKALDRLKDLVESDRSPDRVVVAGGPPAF